jgi:pimeloyl-ACP methyl ester carboxylesterase
VTASAQRWFAPGSIEREPELSGRLLHALQDTDDEGYARCCEALAGYDVRDRLGEIALPVRAIWGRFDQVAPEPKAAEIAGGVRRGSIAVVEDAAHLPPAEQPAATAAALLDFFGASGVR